MADQVLPSSEDIRGIVEELLEKRLTSMAIAPEASKLAGGAPRGEPSQELGQPPRHAPYTRLPHHPGGHPQPNAGYGYPPTHRMPPPPPHHPGGVMHYLSAEHPTSTHPYDAFAPPHYLHAPPPGADGLDWQARPYPPAPFTHQPQAYFDAHMVEDYRNKMDALHAHFNSSLRPKLDALKRQIVTVESRINDVSATRDLLLAEAVAEHQVHVDQVHMCAERKFSMLRTDLDELMRDVQRIHAFTTCLSHPRPQSSAEVMSFISRYMELQAQCSQLSSKGFKTQIDVDPAELRSDVVSMLDSINPARRSTRDGNGSTTGNQGKLADKPVTPPPAGAGGAAGEVEEMAKLLQVKDQMVWMMLKERKELQDKLDAKTSAYKALEETAYKEQQGWLEACERLKVKCDNLEKENASIRAQNEKAVI